ELLEQRAALFASRKLSWQPILKQDTENQVPKGLRLQRQQSSDAMHFLAGVLEEPPNRANLKGLHPRFLEELAVEVRSEPAIEVEGLLMQAASEWGTQQQSSARAKNPSELA